MNQQRWLAASERWLRALLRLYPADFREVMGESLVETYRDRFRAALNAGGVPAVLRLWLRALIDSVHNGVRERVRPSRDPRSGSRFRMSLLDLKLGTRLVSKHPLMTAVAVISWAIGIPVGLAPTHTMNAFEAPPPVESGDRVVGVRYWSVETSEPAPASMYDLAVWSETLTTFKELAAVRPTEYNLDAGTGVAVPVSGAAVTPSAFAVLRTAPLIGRTLNAADDAANAPPVAVLGYDLWESRFGRDPGVVNRTVRISGVLHTVVGVMPEGFLFPVRQQLWLPMREQSTGEPGRGAPLQVFGRLTNSASLQAAEAELSVVAQRMSAEYAGVYGQVNGEVVPFAIAMQGQSAGGFGSQSGALLIKFASLLLLVVACANVGLLIFARTATRSSELAVRAALGAGRVRLVVQVFMEVLVLAVLSTAVGLLFMEFVAERFLAIMTPGAGGMPWWVDLSVTPVTIAKAIVLAISSAAAASIIPALLLTRKIHEPIRRAGATGAPVRLGHLSSVLIIVDMAMAVAVVGLVIGVSDRLEGIANPAVPGFAIDQFLSAEITLSDVSLMTATDTVAAHNRVARIAAAQLLIVKNLEAEPRVKGVAVANALPRMEYPTELYEVEDGTPGDRFGAHEVEFAYVAPGFFEALAQNVVAGRHFSLADLQAERRPVIVNRRFVERTLGGRSAVGRRVRSVSFEDGKPGPWHEIVGVVPDLATNIIEAQNGLAVYEPAATGEIYPMQLAIRVGADPESFIPRLRELATKVDPAAIVTRAESLDEVFPEAWYEMKGFRLGWTVVVGVLLLLAASGMYTIMAFSVAQRTREIGIRAALGAQRSQIIRAIGGRAAIQLGVGALAGIPLAALLYFQVQKYTTSPQTAFLMALIPGVGAMFLVGVLACTAPLLRALRIMPTQAIRGEA